MVLEGRVQLAQHQDQGPPGVHQVVSTHLGLSHAGPALMKEVNDGSQEEQDREKDKDPLFVGELASLLDPIVEEGQDDGGDGHSEIEEPDGLIGGGSGQGSREPCQSYPQPLHSVGSAHLDLLQASWTQRMSTASGKRDFAFIYTWRPFLSTPKYCCPGGIHQPVRVFQGVAVFRSSFAL